MILLERRSDCRDLFTDDCLDLFTDKFIDETRDLAFILNCITDYLTAEILLSLRLTAWRASFIA